VIALGHWRPVVGFLGYEVSDLGRVRGWRVAGGKGGEAAYPSELQPYKKSGYHYVNLRRHSQTMPRAVHRLVLEAFAGPCPEGMHARHFPDGTRTNNSLSNLSWATPVVNNADKLVQGTAQRGERHNQAVLDDGRVMLIRFLSAVHDVDGVRLAEWFGLSPCHAWSVANGRSWKHLPMIARAA